MALWKEQLMVEMMVQRNILNTTYMWLLHNRINVQVLQKILREMHQSAHSNWSSFSHGHTAICTFRFHMIKELFPPESCWTLENFPGTIAHSKTLEESHSTNYTRVSSQLTGSKLRVPLELIPLIYFQIVVNLLKYLKAALVVSEWYHRDCIHQTIAIGCFALLQVQSVLYRWMHY